MGHLLIFLRKMKPGEIRSNYLQGESTKPKVQFVEIPLTSKPEKQVKGFNIPPEDPE